MHIQVKFFATLRQYLPSDAVGGVAAVNVESGVQVSEVLSQLGIPLRQPKSIVILINGKQAQLHQVLRDGDVLSVFPAMAGGSVGRMH